MNTGNNLATIPAGLNTQDLITAINDRLRRVPVASTKTTIIKTIVGPGGATEAGDNNYGTHAQRLAAPISLFPDAALWYETDTSQLYQLQAVGGKAAIWVAIGASGVQQMEVALAAGANTISAAAPSFPSSLTVFLLNPGSGIPTITWGATFSAASTYIDPTPNKLSVFQYAARLSTSMWVLSAQPMTGMTP